MITIELRKCVWFIFMLCFVGLIGWTGCSTTIANKKENPPKKWICNGEADRAFNNQRFETSIHLHETFLKKEPSNALALYHLGYAYGRIGDHRREVFYYEKAVKLGFYQDNIFFNLGMAYGELNQQDKSIRSFKKALTIEPNNSDNHFGLALAYQKKTSYNLAEQEFLRAVKLDPKNIDARLFLSRLYIEIDEKQKAEDQLRKILRISPNHESAQNLLKSLEN